MADHAITAACCSRRSPGPTAAGEAHRPCRGPRVCPKPLLTGCRAAWVQAVHHLYEGHWLPVGHVQWVSTYCSLGLQRADCGAGQGMRWLGLAPGRCWEPACLRSYAGSVLQQ